LESFTFGKHTCVTDGVAGTWAYEILPAILGKDAISIEYPWNEPLSVCVPDGGDLGTFSCITLSAVVIGMSRSTATAQVPCKENMMITKNTQYGQQIANNFQ
jgi:hypothetical protein